jgi:hypothetical protein
MNFIEYIPLEDWALKHKVSQRTAQRWANKEQITTKKGKITKQVVKTWYGYLVRADEPKPQLSKGK